MHAVQAERSQAAGAMIRGTLAPFSIVIVALAALFAGFCTGIAKAAPDSHCKPMLAVIAVINVLIFLFDFAVRPQIVPMRGYIMLFCNGCAALMSVLVAALLGTEEAARKKRGLVAFINFGSTAVVIVAMFGLFFIVVLRPLLLRVLKMQIVPTAAAMAAMPERAKELAGAEAEKAKGGRRALDQTVSARKFRSAFEQELLTHSPRHGDDDDADDMLRRPSRGHRDRDRDRDGEHRRHHHRHSSRSHRRHCDDKHGDDDDEDRSRHHHRHRHHHHRERSKSRSGRDRHSSPRRRDEVADAAANEQRRSSKPSAEAERAASSSSSPRRERDRDRDRQASSPSRGADAKRGTDCDRDRRHKSTSRKDDAAKHSSKHVDAAQDELSSGGVLSSHRVRHQSHGDDKSQRRGVDGRKEQQPVALKTDREHRHEHSRSEKLSPLQQQHRHQSPRRDGASPAAAAAASTSASPRIASPQRVQQYAADQPATNHRHHRHRDER